MPHLFPFSGVRYGAVDGRLDTVVAPPYDVINAADRQALVARSEHNAVRLELPVEEGGRDRYEVAAELWRSWRRAGVLVDDAEPGFYIYRMGYHDEAGRPRQTTGVLGALELSPPGEQILPHEHTTQKDKADRLSLIRACRANLSPIWALTPTVGLGALCEPEGPPDARATDPEGVHHRLWRMTAPARLDAVAELVATAPAIVADGHHRYETALAYQAERLAAGDGPGDHDLILAYVVELAEEQLRVQPIHRLVSGLPEGFDLIEALAAHFEVASFTGTTADLPTAMADQEGLGLVTAKEAFLLRPTPATLVAADQDLDSSRLDVALATLPAHALAFQHGVDHVVAAIGGGQASAGVLLRPATVAQIAATGQGGARMPPKTTFFAPKPRTGMVFRSC